jgi:microcystin-dependent protein
VNANFQFVMAQIAMLADQIAAAVPPGTVLAFAGDTAPPGFLACDGASYATTAYPALSAVIGTTYGGSNGTFAVPDLRGEFIRGLDSTGLRDPGPPGPRSLGSWEDHALQDFRLSETDRDAPGALGVTSVYLAQTGLTYNINGIAGGDAVMARRAPYAGWAAIVPVNANVAAETRPRNVALNYIIKI